MALNLSTLTSPATSGDVLAEALTTADFLEPCPVLKNLSRGSNKGGDAKQDVALNQPKALPLIDGDGYLYVPDVVSNTCSTPDDSSIDITGDITIDIDLTLKNWNDGTERNLVSKYRTSDGQRSYRLFVTTANRLSFVISSSGAFESGGSRSPTATVNFPDNQRAQIRVQWRSSDGRVQFFTSTDKGQTFTQLGVDLFTSGITSIYNGSADLDIAHRTNLNRLANSAIHSVKIYDSVTPSSSSLRLNCDFTATSVRHGDTKFKCATGQVVTINKAGNDPSTIIKKPVLRFSDAASTGLRGVLNQTITDGYMFAAFSVLGNGGETSARVFSINSTGNEDYQVNGSVLSAFRGTNLSRYVAAWDTLHAGMSDDANGDILHEIKIESNAQVSRVNNADEATRTTDISAISAEEFNIGDGSTSSTTTNAAIDLEYLALFDATITDDQADAVRNYINNRNNVFSLVDGFGYYFFDPQALTDGDLNSTTKKLTGLWNGQIVGSDNGDTSFIASQGTSDDQPTSDKYTLTFADNTDHLEIPQVTQAGWQVVGTSLGTFAYRVNNSAQTEINLLGYASYSRKVGDLYGVILLPASATGADINEAKKLLTDRGASVSATADVTTAWRGRSDIVQFDGNMSDVTNAIAAWRNCTSLTSFSTDFPLVTNVTNAWLGCTSLSDFRTTDIKNCADFTSAWQNSYALTSFPAGAKLGTEANNVNFFEAWRGSGLLSFSTPLPTANSVREAWRACTSLTSFSTELPSATNTYRTWYGCSSLSDFKTTNIKNCSDFTGAWQGTTALQSFPSGAQLGTEAANVNFESAWRSSGLTSFSTPLPTAGNVSAAWLGAVYLSSFNTALPLAFNCNSAWAYCSVLVNFNLTSIPEGIYFSQAFRNSGLVDFNTNLPKANTLSLAFKNCQTLKNFSVDVFANWNPASIPSGIFNDAWDGCTSLTAQSVENILTSIDASGKYATSTGASGGSALGDAGIDIDYNVATGSLSAATNAAIRSLDTKGWEVYINGEIRTGVELLDLQGFYFFESEGLAAANVTSWDSSIGASSASLDLVGAQADGNDQPVADGTVVTFADNSDHIDITSTPQAGWQVVGTSLGTFAYRVDNDAVTELNLLGNAALGDALGFRQAGDLYGIVLLPTSATNAQLNETKKLLIDRGASEQAEGSNYYAVWYIRKDIVEFSAQTFPNATNFGYAWATCISMSDFGAIQAPVCTNFTSAWQGCSALTSFPAGAKLGTAASSGVNFSSAWKSSGLTSFSTPLPTAANAYQTWSSCVSLESFSAELPSVNNAREAWYNCSSLESFSAELPSLTNALFAWDGCSSLTSFDVPLPSVNAMYRAWARCSSLTDFSEEVFADWNPSSISSGVFDFTWYGCTSLTAQSVENILTSIDASGKYATATGASGGSALGDAGIDIDYDGTTLSAATNAAIDSLSGKGWEVYINGVLVIPNILDLQPAAAYSLRSFDADADPNVVNVRRSSDGATSDFTASEVSDGTLVAFVGAGNDGHVTIWYDQGGTSHATQTLVSNMPKLVDGGTLVTEGGLAALDFNTEVSNLSLDHSDLYGQATLDSYYVTRADTTLSNSYAYPALVNSANAYGMVSQPTDVASPTSIFYGSPTYYANSIQLTSPTRDSIYQATSGGQKLVSHIGADTTNVEWSAHDINFGNLSNNASFGYTGKLQEMIFFNTDQSANRTAIENNINDTYTIY